ncbi:hypothetical protein DERF_014960 [Dermatophagoides farinae]|uniref:Uncharacterized protein n=1 Tax=Dermatophagoides farinae TaxID=6954 RepID=A0A922HNG7_DERFA|nr:hypothetical protein DERF_014960 [Dermatophagoides farinae]
MNNSNHQNVNDLQRIIHLLIWPNGSLLSIKNKTIHQHIIRLTTSKLDELFMKRSSTLILLFSSMFAFFIFILMIFIIFCLITNTRNSKKKTTISDDNYHHYDEFIHHDHRTIKQKQQQQHPPRIESKNLQSLSLSNLDSLEHVELLKSTSKSNRT